MEKEPEVEKGLSSSRDIPIGTMPTEQMTGKSVEEESDSLPFPTIPESQPLEVIDEKPQIIPSNQTDMNVSSTQDTKDDGNKTVTIEPQEFESNLRSYLVKVSPQFIQECFTYDNAWDEDFRKHVGSNYPYTMSPRTTELIANVSTEFKKEMSKVGFKINPWKISSDEEPFVMGVLRRVMVTDTIEPIIGYTDHIAKHLKDVKEKDPSHVLSIRSFFCGAGVADKCLITRLYESGISANLIATDIAADSIAVAALNFSVWNELLPENERYQIHIVKGTVPNELYSRDKTIVFQVEDALSASEEDSKHPVKFDALVLDNGLQYVSQEFTRELISNLLPNVGKEGLYIGALGLDSNIKVEISKLYHLGEILKSQFIDIRKDYAKKTISKAPYEYPHKYGFSVDKKSGMILINSVISDGAARMYIWLGKLLKGNRTRFSEVMDAVKSATELSRANKAVETTPFDYHNAMYSAITSKGYTVEELERPLDYEDFGWQKVGEDLFSNGKETVDGSTMMRICKEQDPLVLRRSRLLVKNS